MFSKKQKFILIVSLLQHIPIKVKFVIELLIKDYSQPKIRIYLAKKRRSVLMAWGTFFLVHQGTLYLRKTIPT